MTVYIMNSDSKVNPSKLTEQDEPLIIVEKKNKVIIAIRSDGGVTNFSDIDDWSLITIDTGLGHRDGGSGRIIGIASHEKSEGVVPSKKVPVYVFK